MPHEPASSPLLEDGPRDAELAIVLAHGAGAPMQSAFMQSVATALASAGNRVVRFNFPYMQLLSETGKKTSPDPAAKLMASWREVVAEIRPRFSDIVIGGKSLGGRMATMVADEVRPLAVVCFGYPFHPPGRPDKVRTEHLREMRTPTLIVQGTRDPFGTPEDVKDYQLSPAIRTAWIEDGDHSLKPRKFSGRTERDNLREAVDVTVRFLDQLRASRRP